MVNRLMPSLLWLSNVPWLCAAGLATKPGMFADSVFDLGSTQTHVYGQGLVDVTKAGGRAVNLTLHAWAPRQRAGGPAVPSSPRPVLVFVHGGGFSGTIADDKALKPPPDIEYFVQRGGVGVATNYRLTEDDASWPTAWPLPPYLPHAFFSLKPIAGVNTSDWWGQRFTSPGATPAPIQLWSDNELCVAKGLAGSGVWVQPCNETTSETWVYTQATAELKVTETDGRGGQQTLCLTAPYALNLSLSVKAAPCNGTQGQKWTVVPLPDGGNAVCADVPGPHLCLTFTGDFSPPLHNLYPAVRDCKAAVRWIRAVGPSIGIDPTYIILDGGSAGASTVLAAAIARLEGDYLSELTDAEDPTLASTHPEVSSQVAAVVAHWGAAYGVVAALAADPAHRDRYTEGAWPLPPVIEFNGLIDATIPIQHARAIEANYSRVGGDMTIVPLPHYPHACWDANVTAADGSSKTQSQVAYEWIVKTLGLPYVH